MQNMQFETDGNEFECIECGRKIKIPETEEEAEEIEMVPKGQTRKITCPTCGTEYDVGKNTGGMGLTVTPKTETMTELEEVTERELEQSND